MMKESDQEMFKSFVEFCDYIMKTTGCSKGDMSRNLGLKDAAYFSNLYNGHRPVPKHIWALARDLYELHKKSASDLGKNLDTPENLRIRDHLAEDIATMREKITKLESDKDSDRKDKNELRERIAVLEERLRQTSADSEKKIRDIVAEAIRGEAERIADRLPGRPRQAANDE